MRFYLIPVIFLLVSCGSTTSDTNVCEPGKQEVCSCGDTNGFQVCEPDGSGWGACNCDCEEDCTGLDCGPGPVCGESCGECGDYAECTEDGQCECLHLMCSGICCPDGAICHQGDCCIASCAGKECGSDGCAGSCGECTGDDLCDPDGQCVEPGCGNGIQEPGEQCDTNDFGEQDCMTASGNTQGDLQCTESCFLDISNCHTCGNGKLEGPEVCEGDLFGGETCATQSNYDSGDLTCTADCQIDTSKCYTCGNSIIEGTESCDGLVLGGATCQTHSVHPTGQLACGADCHSFNDANCYTCGDNQLRGPEICDGTNLAGETCASLTQFDDGVPTCNANCLGFNTSTCHTCGNGTIEGPEECEGANLNNQTCLTLLGLDDGTLSCDLNCMFDTSDCRDCGNGIAEGPEGCDGEDFWGDTCADWGYEVGELQCTQSCVLNLELCFDCNGCCGHGDCMYNDNTQEPWCDCDPGYHEEEGLKCAKDYPSIWPPDIDDLWHPQSHICVVPECDECGVSDLDSTVVWSVAQFTTNSTCRDAVLGADPWSVENFPYAFDTTLPDMEGTCMNNEEGFQIGTAIAAKTASCRTIDFTGLIIVNEVEREVIDFTSSPPRGLVRVYVNANELFGHDDCEYEMTRTYNSKQVK